MSISNAAKGLKLETGGYYICHKNSFDEINLSNPLQILMFHILARALLICLTTTRNETWLVFHQAVIGLRHVPHGIRQIKW